MARVRLAQLVGLVGLAQFAKMGIAQDFLRQTCLPLLSLETVR